MALWWIAWPEKPAHERFLVDRETPGRCGRHTEADEFDGISGIKDWLLGLILQHSIGMSSSAGLIEYIQGARAVAVRGGYRGHRIMTLDGLKHRAVYMALHEPDPEPPPE